MIFVAQPYYSFEKSIVDARVALGSKYCGALINEGQMCISPVVFGTTILNHCVIPSDFSYWDKISFTFLEKCDEMHVLMLDGWDESHGVTDEIVKAKELNIRIKYISIGQMAEKIQSQFKKKTK